jgi:hypothetical protein
MERCADILPHCKRIDNAAKRGKVGSVDDIIFWIGTCALFAICLEFLWGSRATAREAVPIPVLFFLAAFVAHHLGY